MKKLLYYQSSLTSLFSNTGFGIMYLLFLTFVLFQSYQDVREMMIFLDPSLKNSGPDTEVIVTFVFSVVHRLLVICPKIVLQIEKSPKVNDQTNVIKIFL